MVFEKGFARIEPEERLKKERGEGSAASKEGER